MENNMLAKPIVKNKFWIVEDQHGEKVGTIQTIENGSQNVVLVRNKHRTKYPSIKVLSEKHHIKFCETNEITKVVEVELSTDVYGYPTEDIAYNGIFDIEKNLPIYTTTQNGKSFYAAGHYLISYCNNWVKSFCPKLMTLERNKYEGPFRTFDEMADKQQELKNANN